jgi:CHAD domain-containing protein
MVASDRSRSVPGDTAGLAARTALRLCNARIEAAQRALTPPAPGDVAVHLARTELKRARTVLRLLRPALDRRRWRLADRSLRDVGRELAAARDAAALLAALQAAARAAGLPAGALRTPLGRLARQRRTLLETIDTRRARLALGVLRARIVRTPLDDDWLALAAGFARIYRRARRRFASARAAPRPGRLHEWRKDVKHYRHALEVLAPAWVRILPALAREAHRLADTLGSERDLARLAARLDALAILPGARRRLRAAIARERRRLRAEAFALGARLFAEQPRRNAARTAGYWARWAAAIERSARPGKRLRGRAN